MNNSLALAFINTTNNERLSYVLGSLLSSECGALRWTVGISRLDCSFCEIIRVIL